ncbi:MAG TPA: hypothetical protein PKC28_16825, partial [Bdellovibrionales bacterium]|nr:hypothetical protein [Bdellovibrionales bacterium]
LGGDRHYEMTFRRTRLPGQRVFSASWRAGFALSGVINTVASPFYRVVWQTYAGVFIAVSTVSRY